MWQIDYKMVDSKSYQEFICPAKCGEGLHQRNSENLICMGEHNVRSQALSNYLPKIRYL